MAIFLRSFCGWKINSLAFDVRETASAENTHHRMEQTTRDREKRTTEKKSYASNKPWWLVIFIVVLLVGFLFYIKWLNSPAAKEYRSFWAYLVEPKSTEVKSDSLAAPVDDIAALFGTDSTSNADAGFTDEWAEATSPATTTPADNGFSENNSATPANNPALPAPSSAPPVAAPSAPSAGIVYVINAGEFKSKGSAQFRISELRQGNYAARLIEPTSPDGMYKVVVGEYQKESTARSVAQSMSFILEIRASVEEKR